MKRPPLPPKRTQKIPKFEKLKPCIKAKFFDAGIRICELKYDGCLAASFLTFAHSLKRRHIMTPAQMEEVILACQHCHNIIEAMGEEPMYEIVTNTIEQRVTEVKSCLQ